ncbi:MAG: OmpA family protein [Saprospiraceae bacterium]|nr:OmpA family protein [Saprospiraceae bacterium]
MKKQFALIIGAALLTVGLQAQPLNRSTPEANLKSAQEAEADGNPYAAAELYERYLSENKQDKQIQAKVAKLNFDLRDYEKAEKGFSRLVNRDRKLEFTELKYWLALSMKYNGKYAEATDMFNQYIENGADEGLKKKAKLEIAGCELARKMKQPENVIIANLGKTANNPQTDGSPSYSSGELYFTSIRSKEVVVLNGKEGDWHSKVYTTTKSGAEYGEPEPLGTQINREGWHQGNVSITGDGKTMYFTRVELTEKGQDIGASKIFVSQKGSDGWGGANEATGVNGDFIAKHPCEGELFGEKVLFFVANMPGGKGGFDIYYAPKKGDNMFGLPVNLGGVINSEGDEASPFYQDGKLFFSSNGRPNIGGYDVYESQWNGSVWSEPKILPMGINTSVDDLHYSRSADGFTGFLQSNRPGPNNLKSKTCCDDVYQWELERIKVELLAKTFRVRLKKENLKENPPLKGAVVTMLDITEKKAMPVDEKTNLASNEFPFTLQPDRTYLIVANAEGYKPDSLTFNTNGVKKSTTVEKKLTLRLLKKEPEYDTLRINEPIRLDNILYDYDKDNIRPDAEPDLQSVVDLMKKYPEMKIELSSHTDARGNDAYNEDLSQRRANSAVAWIVAKGIGADRIVAKGYGEKQLQNKCANGVECTEEEHQLNRRTEFKITAGPTSIVIERVEKREKKPADGSKN